MLRIGGGDAADAAYVILKHDKLRRRRAYTGDGGRGRRRQATAGDVA